MAWGRGQYWSFWGQHQPLPQCDTFCLLGRASYGNKYSVHGKAGNEQGVLWGGVGAGAGERKKNETDKKRYKVRESATEMEMKTGRDK